MTTPPRSAEASPEEYVANLVAIFREVRRVLSKDGTLWLNVGDGYARNGGTGNCGPNAVVGNTKKLIQKRNCKVPECWGLKDRDLMGLPWRVAFALQADGWILRSRITWIKKTAMPESVKNRPTAPPRKSSCLRSRRATFTIPEAFANQPAQTFATTGCSDPTPAARATRPPSRANSFAAVCCSAHKSATRCSIPSAARARPESRPRSSAGMWS